jgi:hypothetical protein
VTYPVATLNPSAIVPAAGGLEPLTHAQEILEGDSFLGWVIRIAEILRKELLHPIAEALEAALVEGDAHENREKSLGDGF